MGLSFLVFVQTILHYGITFAETLLLKSEMTFTKKHLTNPMPYYAAFVKSISWVNSIRLYPRLYLLSLSVLSGGLFCLAWCSAWFGWLLCVAIIPPLLIVRHFTMAGGQKPFPYCFFYILLTLFFWNCLTIWWIANAAFAAFLFTACYNAVCLSIPWLVYYYTRKWVGTYMAYLGLVACWLTLEHAHLSWEFWELTFPWLNLGNGLAAMAHWIQWYEYTGILGGSLWILGINIMFYHLLFEQHTPLILKTFYGWLLLPLSISLIIYYSYNDKGIGVEVVTVQPNFDSYTEKSTSSPLFVPYASQIDRLLTLSQKELTTDTCLVVWPESAIDCCLEEIYVHDYICIQPILQFLEKQDTLNLITGASSFRAYGVTKATETARKRGAQYVDYYNSIFYFKAGSNVAIYHKEKRLPGAEYIPYFHSFPEIVLRWIKQKMAEIGDIDPCLGKGNGSKVFEINRQIKVAPINCYESIYGAFAGSASQKGANLFAVLTNDCWWGNTPVYYHHFQYSCLLAIAHRKSVVRAANTGICGFINQRGDVIAATKPLESIAMRRVIQANNQITFYSLHGDYIGYMASYALFILIFLALVMLLYKKQKSCFLYIYNLY